MHSSLFFGISLSLSLSHTHTHTLFDDLGIDSWVGEKYNSVSVEKKQMSPYDLGKQTSQILVWGGTGP